MPNIASYFRPVTRQPASPPPPPPPPADPAAAAAAAPQSQPQPSSPSSKLTSPPASSPPPPPFSSPGTSRSFATPQPGPARPQVIAASDDEGDFGADDSDDSLVDFMNFAPAAATTTSRNLFGTPQAKRIARDLFASPRRAPAPRLKVDFQALAQDARRDDAVQAAAAAAAAPRSPSPPARPASPSLLLGGVIGDVVKDGRDTTDARKVLRTVQRTDLLKAQTWYCFFDRDYRPPPSSPAPRLPAGSPWRLLTHANSAARERNLASGLPQTILMKQQGGLPDDVFRWILDELCVSRSTLTRQEYCNIIADCPEQVRRLITPERLRALFLRLGASAELEALEAPLTVSKPSHRPYQDRDWSCVISFLFLLDVIAGSLSAPSAIFAVRVLLRMGLDQIMICNVDLHTAWDDAINRLISAVPQSLWDSFCSETCALLHANIKPQFIRINTILCLSPRAPSSHDIRRRLAAAYLFDDPSIARRHPSDVITVRRLSERLDADDFAISKTTDFTELKARIMLLDTVLDDGSAPAPGRQAAAAAAEDAFNADIDELVNKLQAMANMINDTGMKIVRTETKSLIEWVQKRLKHSLRTKPAPVQNVYDRIQGAKKLDPSLPAQQELMRTYFQMAPKQEAGESSEQGTNM